MPRIRARPTISSGAALNIGVTLTRTGAPPRRVQCSADDDSGGGGSGEIDGPVVVAGDFGGSGCNWMVYLTGTPPAAEIIWSMTWDGMDDDYAGAVSFLIDDPSNSLPFQRIETTSSSIYNLQIFATVNGEVFGPETVECAF